LCEYCRSQARFAIDPLVIDHIHPVSRGGKTITENLALSCQTCNNYKYTKTEAPDPVTNQSVSLFHPREMVWEDNFTWNEDVTQAIGITPVGRATIVLLQINREGVVNQGYSILMGELIWYGSKFKLSSTECPSLRLSKHLPICRIREEEQENAIHKHCV
jgi:HNH endonuclease